VPALPLKCAVCIAMCVTVKEVRSSWWLLVAVRPTEYAQTMLTLAAASEAKRARLPLSSCSCLCFMSRSPARCYSCVGERLGLLHELLEVVGRIRSNISLLHGSHGQSCIHHHHDLKLSC